MPTALVAINGVIFGLFISAVTRKETQSLLAAMISLLIFMSFMTFLWPRETMHPAMQSLARFMPYIYGVEAIRSVNLVGAGFPEVWPHFFILILFITAQVLLTVLLFPRRIT